MSQPEISMETVRKAVFPLDDGDVTLIYPSTLSEEGIDKLKLYLEILMKVELKKARKLEDSQ